MRRLPAKWVWPFSRAVGRILYWCSPKYRCAVKKAYERLVERAGIARSPAELTISFFERHPMLMTAAYAMQGHGRERFDELCVTQGFESLLETLRQGRGILLVTMHFGSHLLTMVRLEMEGVRIATVRPREMADILDPKQRSMLFIDRPTIYVDEGEGLASPLRHIVRYLRDGWCVGFAPDGDQGQSLMALRFFGGHYLIRRGLHEIIRLARCPVVYAQGAARNGKYNIWYSDVMEPPRNGDVDAFSEEVTAFIEKQFERIVRENPESIWWTRPMEMALGLRPLPPEFLAAKGEISTKSST